MMPVQGSFNFRGLFKLAFAVPVAASFVIAGCGGDTTPIQEPGTPPELDPTIQMENTTTEDPSLGADAAEDDPAISG